MPGSKGILIAGDVLALGLVTAIGFITHRETELSFLPRVAALYVPLSIFWLVFAAWFKLFNPEPASNPKQLWRPALAMLLAAPLAVTVRNALLSTDFVPVFALVFTAASAFGLTLWRGLYCLVKRKS